MRRNYFLRHVIEGKVEVKMEVKGKRGRIRNMLLYDLKGKRGYCKVKDETLECTLRRTGFGIGYGPVVILNY